MFACLLLWLVAYMVNGKIRNIIDSAILFYQKVVLFNLRLKYFVGQETLSQ